MIKRILIVDDEPLIRKSLAEILRIEGYEVACAEDGMRGLQMIGEEPFNVIIADLKMPQLDGMGFLRCLREMNKDVPVVMITAYGSVETAVEAMKQGAFDYITKPIVDNEIKIVIKRILEQQRMIEENRFLRKRLSGTKRGKFYEIIGQNYEMQKIYNLIETVAPTNASILIQGESGTGKRLIAQALHSSSPQRKNKPFVEVSCGALPETLLESELFGHVKGAFTSAIKDRQGRFEAANGGSIFLDEIDTFSPKLQVKLLRVLQEGEFEKVGDTKTIRVDVRVLAATNQNLKSLIEQNLFREDLYYRLNVIPINVPPLRDRKDDILMLVEHFLKKYSKKVGRKVTSLGPGVLQVLTNYNWPGNIRELENVIERAVILCKGTTVLVEDLPEFMVKINPSQKGQLTNKKSYSSLKEALKESEKDIIESILKESGGNRKKAAELLGINRTTLYNKMREYGLLKEE